MALSSLSPLRHRSFALAMTSSFVSSIGTWMQSVALGIYLTETTRNPIWLGLLTVSAWTPAIIGAPVGGVVADRWSRQRWIQFNNFVMACTASALAVAAVTHHLSPSLACYLAVGEGLCSSASWAAWQSLLPDLVDQDEVLAAVSLSSAQFNLGRVIGPVFAAIALGVGVGRALFRSQRRVVHLRAGGLFVRAHPVSTAADRQGALLWRDDRRSQARVARERVSQSDRRHRRGCGHRQPLHRARAGHGDHCPARRHRVARDGARGGCGARRVDTADRRQAHLADRRCCAVRCWRSPSLSVSTPSHRTSRSP